MQNILNNFTGEDYYNFYIGLLSFYIIAGSLILRHIEKDRSKFLRNDRNLLIAFVCLITIVFGTRGIRIGTDTWNYFTFYFLPGIRRTTDAIKFFSYFETDFIFEVIMFLTFPFKNFTLFILTVSAILNYATYVFVRKFTNNGQSGSSLFLFLIIASSFVFFSHQVNTIRNGLAIPFIFFAIYYAAKESYRKMFFFFVVAYLCHRTALIPLVCTLCALIGRNISLRYFIITFIIGIGLSAAGFGFDKIPFLATLGTEDFQSLSFEGETTYRLGFRPSFVLYNSMFLFLFYKFSDLKNSLDLLLIKYYITASVVFFFNFNIPFSDRIGVYSWIAIPLLFYSTIQNSYPNKKLFITSVVAFFYFILNFIVIPFI